ncbi:hypothetical protein LWI29_005105 [Acer saccharum]|uniref:Uncharacterized protein n=1 Tax=Acer saccharum TaxID=4024 RepID=A0AA39TP28_ACESA|nr:hypothetical protein LWI29_005105 [Acer saccharum]
MTAIIILKISQYSRLVSHSRLLGIFLEGGFGPVHKAKQGTQDIKSNQGRNCVDEIDSEESLQFNFSTIKAATNDFLDDNKLGQGGFGAVYKGRLSNGQDIATVNLLTYAWKNWKDGTALNVMDPTLRVGSTSEILRCIHIGLLCVQENVASRPTMALVVVMLTSGSVSLPGKQKIVFSIFNEKVDNNMNKSCILKWKP